MFSLARRTVFKAVKKQAVAPTPAKRSFGVSAFRRADDHHAGAPVIQGEGGKVGSVPSDFEQATGLERMELLAKMRGEDPFHMAPLEVNHMGTPKNPVPVFSLDTERIMGCTGFPIDSHDTLYNKVRVGKDWRCPECGCCYTIDYHGDANAGHGHH